MATTIPSFVRFPLGVTSGAMDQTYDLTLAGSWNAAFVTAHGGTTAGAEFALAAGLAAGTSYLDIHTTANPGGEIRSFLVPLIFYDGFDSGDACAWSAAVGGGC